MLVPRSVATRRARSRYEATMRDVLGPPGRGGRDTLALIWAHQIAWTAHGAPVLDELELLGAAARQYDLPLDDVLAERRQVQQAPPVVPAGRGTVPEEIRRLA